MFNSFHKRLNKLGYSSYRDYLLSEHWKNKKADWKKSYRFPQFCLGCDGKEFQLHHRSYARLGDELLEDLIPLCGVCHQLVHIFLKTSRTKLSGTHRIMRDIFGWSKKKTREKFRSFSNTKKGFRWIKKREAC